MLLNNSYKDPEITRNVHEEVGKPFTLKERIKLKGIGSPKLHIINASMGIRNLLTINNSTNTCNIELRPKGIVIGFHIRLETYILVIPFYKLVLYKGKSDEYTFYRDQYFIKIRAGAQDTAIHNFVKKIIKLKDDNAPTKIEDL